LLSKNYQEALLYAVSVAMVSALLIAFNRFLVEESGDKSVPLD
jgi:hypothetical protein